MPDHQTLIFENEDLPSMSLTDRNKLYQMWLMTAPPRVGFAEFAHNKRIAPAVTPSKNPQLHPCASCGGPAASQEDHNDAGFFVECVRCGMQTGYFDTEEESKRSWQTVMGSRSSVGRAGRS